MGGHIVDFILSKVNEKERKLRHRILWGVERGVNGRKS